MLNIKNIIYGSTKSLYKWCKENKYKIIFDFEMNEFVTLFGGRKIKGIQMEDNKIYVPAFYKEDIVGMEKDTSEAFYFIEKAKKIGEKKSKSVVVDCEGEAILEWKMQQPYYAGKYYSERIIRVLEGKIKEIDTTGWVLQPSTSFSGWKEETKYEVSPWTIVETDTSIRVYLPKNKYISYCVQTQKEEIVVVGAVNAQPIGMKPTLSRCGVYYYPIIDGWFEEKIVEGNLVSKKITFQDVSQKFKGSMKYFINSTDFLRSINGDCHDREFPKIREFMQGKSNLTKLLLERTIKEMQKILKLEEVKKNLANNIVVEEVVEEKEEETMRLS